METPFEALTILVLCASPAGDLVTLKLSHELARIEKQLAQARLPIRMRRVFPPTIEQLQRELGNLSVERSRPAIFHFLGHGDDDGLYFEDELGNSRLVKGPELKAALAKSPVRLSLLNACWSATKRGVSLIEFLTREAVSEAAIGHEVPVNDESAIHFADLLIEQLIAGQSVKVAAQTAANALAGQGLLGGADVRWAGNAELRITEGLTPGPANFVLEDGFPKVGRLPDEGLFFGRGEQLVQIATTLADPSKVGVGLWGIGGIGKTSLALHAARRNAWRYRGTAWVDIRDLPHKTTVDLLRRALGRLSPGASQDDPAFALEQFLPGTPSLIVLDNLEDLPLTEVPALARFLQQMPRNGSQLLLTGRVPLREVEQVTDFQSIKLTDGLDGWHGPRYLQHVARQKNCDLLKDELRVIGGEIDTLIRRLEGKCVLISQRLHGHPKMLELAVGLALQGEAQLNAALHALPEHLEDQVAPLLETSFAALGAEGRQLLPLLRYFPTGRLMPESLEYLATIGAVQADSAPEAVDEDAAGDEDEDEDATADEPVTPDWYAPGLRQLLQSGLLDYDQVTDTYAFHQSILDAIGPQDDMQQLWSVLLLHYAQYISGCAGDNDRIDRCFENALQLMEAFWPIVNESAELAALLSRMVSRIGYFFEQRGWGEVGEIWHTRNLELLKLFETDSPAVYTAEMARMASLLASRGAPDQARALLTEALERAESLKDEHHIAALLNQLAVIEQSQGNSGEARRLVQRSRQIIEVLGDQQGLATLLHGLASIEESQGNPSEARRLLLQSLQIKESIGDQLGLHESLHELAKIEQSQGNPGEARRLLQRSLQITERLGNQRGVAASLHELGRIELSQENPGEARRLLQQSLQINESLGNQQGLSASLHELARIERSHGNSGEARRLLQRSVQIDEGLGDQRGVAASLNELANLEMLSGDRSVARELWKRSIRITSEIGDIAGAVMTKANLAKLEALEGHGDRALELAREAVRELESLGYADAEKARQNLRDIEQYLAGDRSGGQPRIMSQLTQRIAQWQGLSEEERADQLARYDHPDDGIDEATATEAVLNWLAHSVSCFRERDLAGCEAAENRARQWAAASPELSALVEGMSEQRRAATQSPSSPSEQSIQAAIEQLESQNPAAALPLLEQAIAQARSENQPLLAAQAQFYLGQCLVLLNQPGDAVPILQEALQAATQLDETDLIAAIQQILPIAVQRARKSGGDE